jgi:Family of unknown function (DUF7002)
MLKEELITTYPLIYHMAECDSWDNIKKHGLLSTSAILDLYDYSGTRRAAIESQHRPQKITITNPKLPDAVVRDQKPMNDTGLNKCLVGRVTPQEWYELLNTKTFFWASKERLLGLLNARAYRDEEHDVLTINAESLVNEYEQNIVLCPMNSGATIPFNHPRGLDKFKTIADYDFESWTKKKGGRKKAVVEICIEGGAPNIFNHVVSVDRMMRKAVLSNIYSK